MENSKEYYVYRHIRLDKNEPFYIGVGTANTERKTFHSYYWRAFAKYKRSRNSIWHNIYKKSEIEIEIICTSDNYKDILEKEMFFIKLYGRIDLGTGTLANLTDGGELNPNRIRKNIKYRPVYIYTIEGEYICNLQNHPLFLNNTIERKRLYQNLTGRQKSAYGFQFSYEKLSKIPERISIRDTEEFKLKLSSNMKGNQHTKGRKLSKDHIERLREGHKKYYNKNKNVESKGN